MVHVVAYYPPHLGGMEAVARNLAAGLARTQPVEVITARCGPAPPPSPNLTVRRLFHVEVAHTPVMPALLWHLLRLPPRALVHLHVAQAYLPEMVWLWSRLRRRPYVAHFHLDCDPSGRWGILHPAYKRLILGGVLRGATWVIALNEDQASLLERRHRVPANRIVTIPNGVGPESFLPPRTGRGHNGPFRLLFVGRLSPQKNVPRLLKALAQTRAPMELVIAGDGEHGPLLEGLVQELQLDRVRMVGSQSPEELRGWYGWADALVLPSDKEGMPLVLLEAMAAGLPIIATDIPGVRETVGRDAILTRPDPEAMAQALDRLATDPALWAELATRSAARGRRHATLDTVSAVLKLYDRTPA